MKKIVTQLTNMDAQLCIIHYPCKMEWQVSLGHKEQEYHEKENQYKEYLDHQPPI